MRSLVLAPLRTLAARSALVALGLHAQVAISAGPAGEVTHVSGAVMAQKADGQSRILTVKSKVEEGDVVATADNSYARVKFTDGTEAVLRPASQVKIDQFNFEEQKPQADGMILSLLKGGFRSVTGLLGKRNPANMRVATPSATIGIRGTTFQADIIPPAGGGGGGAGLAPGLYVQVLDGVINLSNKGGSQNFSAGQFGFTPNFNQPPVIIPVNPGIQFTPPPSFLGPSGQAGGIGKSGGSACTI
jgi:FecR-like protein